VERRQGNGTYVTATSEDAIIKPLALSIFSEKDNILDIFSVRKLLEPEIAELAAKNASDKEIEILEKIIKKQEKYLSEGKNPIGIDSEFHHKLAKISKNKVLERLLCTLVRILAKTREAYLQTDERQYKSLSGHKEILAAIKLRHGTFARQAMKRHLQEVEKTIFKKEGVKKEIDNE